VVVGLPVISLKLRILIWIDLGGAHSIGAPIQVYPLYENAFRAHRGQSVEENMKESSELYAKFAQVAAQNPKAWFYGKEPATAEIISTITKKNRWICSPCKW
jgi:hypothetical protein